MSVEIEDMRPVGGYLVVDLQAIGRRAMDSPCSSISSTTATAVSKRVP